MRGQQCLFDITVRDPDASTVVLHRRLVARWRPNFADGDTWPDDTSAMGRRASFALDMVDFEGMSEMVSSQSGRVGCGQRIVSSLGGMALDPTSGKAIESEPMSHSAPPSAFASAPRSSDGHAMSRSNVDGPVARDYAAAVRESALGRKRGLEGRDSAAAENLASQGTSPSSAPKRPRILAGQRPSQSAVCQPGSFAARPSLTICRAPDLVLSACHRPKQTKHAMSRSSCRCQHPILWPLRVCSTSCRAEVERCSRTWPISASWTCPPTMENPPRRLPPAPRGRTSPSFCGLKTLASTRYRECTLFLWRMVQQCLAADTTRRSVEGSRSPYRGPCSLGFRPTKLAYIGPSLTARVCACTRNWIGLAPIPMAGTTWIQSTWHLAHRLTLWTSIPIASCRSSSTRSSYRRFGGIFLGYAKSTPRTATSFCRRT